jgi:hypothetical protein
LDGFERIAVFETGMGKLFFIFRLGGVAQLDDFWGRESVKSIVHVSMGARIVSEPFLMRDRALD